MSKLADKKGSAIELAIFMLLFVFALCSLVVSLVYVSTINRNSQLADKSRKVEMEQIGEAFVQGTLFVENDTLKSPTWIDTDKYVLTISNENGKQTLTVTSGIYVLTVEKDGNNVLAWTYEKLPETPETDN